MSGTSEFDEEAHRQSALVGASNNADEDQAWVDDISIFNDEAFSDVQAKLPAESNADLLSYLRHAVWPLLTDRAPCTKQQREQILGYDPESGV